MAHPSPLQTRLEALGGCPRRYGPPDAGIDLFDSFADPALEYAALRRAAVLLDRPERSVLEVTGTDRLDFLNRMLTQELKGIGAFQTRRSFWLNRKGRIDADLVVLELGDRTVLELDAHAAARTLQGLGAYLVAEDAAIRDITPRQHRLSLHGPAAAAFLADAIDPGTTPLPHDPRAIPPGLATRLTIAGRPVTAWRADDTGELGLEVLLAAGDAEPVFGRFAGVGLAAGPPAPEPEAFRTAPRVRLAGWEAYNVARIEAGTPLYYIDFSPDSLPAETGVLLDRVSFTKGCYLGQEVVARMHARGHSKRTLVAFRAAPPAADAPPDRALPESGDQVFADAALSGDPIGVVTSSTISPMLGAAVIGFAAVRSPAPPPGSDFWIEHLGRPVEARVQPGLSFWRRA